MSFVILNCTDIVASRSGLQVLAATNDEVGDMLGTYLYVRVCTTCGTLQARTDGEDNFRTHTPDHPMAIKFRAIVYGFRNSPHSTWGLAPDKFPACHVIGAIHVAGFKTFHEANVDCPGCGLRSF